MPKKKSGRPSKFKPKYCKMLIDWMSVAPHTQVLKKEIIKSNGTIEREYMPMAAKLPTLEGFARSIGVDDDTLANWANAVNKSGKPKYPAFFGAYKIAKQLQKEFLLANGLAGLTPPASFIFVTKNVTDMKDKQEVDHTSKGEKVNSVIGITYVVPETPEEHADSNSS